MSKLICVLLLTAFSAAFADQELVDLAQKVLDMLNPNAQNSNQNSILLALTNGDHVTHQLLLGNSSNSVRVNVTFSGTVAVSAERNTKRVQVSTQYKGGAVLSEKDRESKRDDSTETPNPAPVDGFLGDLYKELEKDAEVLAADETAVLIAHGAETGKAFRDNTRRAEAKLRGGFIVGSKTSVKYN